DPPGFGQGPRVSHTVLVDVHAGHSAAPSEGQIHRGTTGLAAYLPYFAGRRHLELVRELEPFRDREPAALTDVFAEGSSPDGGLGATRKVGVDIVVEINGGGRRGVVGLGRGFVRPRHIRLSRSARSAPVRASPIIYVCCRMGPA